VALQVATALLHAVITLQDAVEQEVQLNWRGATRFTTGAGIHNAAVGLRHSLRIIPGVG
jgi:hypothetical protein